MPINPDPLGRPPGDGRRVLWYALGGVGVLLVLGLAGLGLADRFLSQPLEPAAAVASPMPAVSDSDLRFRDPVTNQVVDPTQALYQVDLYGTTFYFASRASLDRFREDPLRYVQPRVKIRVQLAPEGSPDAQETGAPTPDLEPSVPSEGDSWMDPAGPPPPIEAEAVQPPAGDEPVMPEEAPAPSQAVPAQPGQEESEPILPDEPPRSTAPAAPAGSQAPPGGPGWLPGNEPARLPDAQVQTPGSMPTVSPGDQDVIIDERAPQGR